MGKSKLLKKITELEEMVSDYQKFEEKSFKMRIDFEALQKENIELRRKIDALNAQMREMGNSKKLHDEIQRCRDARNLIAMNHENVWNALTSAKARYKFMLEGVEPYFEKLENDIHALSDEFLIPFDKFSSSGCNQPEKRIKEWDARCKKVLQDA
ncbi:MAG: hypothetical protein PHN18_12595 [Sulfurospirillaceae bacterium]|nr:hypothetical protein [Sulfurospirillaceae bacterium]MDD2827702.1 hypothetical protein [Sulfurospirillaceae bacterium]